MTAPELVARWQESGLFNLDPTLPAGSVHARFSRQAAETPQAPAVTSFERQLSYEQLEAESNQFAALLIEKGVGVGQCVALCAERSAEMVVALLGILKVGAAYVPIVSTYPRERIAFMLEDTGTSLAVADRASVGSLPSDLAHLILDERPWHAHSTAACPADVPATDPAYIMYTSGSTGTPKGAVIVHRAIERLLNNDNCLRLGPGEVVLHAAPIAFDASTIEVWGPLLTGGTLALFPDAIPTAARLGECIEKFGVTSMWLTAALFNLVIDHDPKQLSGLKQLISGGEALSVEHIKRAQLALPNTELINGYGPTETTTFAACFRIPCPLPEDWTSIPIGTPISQTLLYIADVASGESRPAEPGQVGELWIGGWGLAQQYLNQPELTDKAFIVDPIHPEQRVYRTGDLVRLTDKGCVDYVGRVDQQVKIRGFRIEPGEIEAALCRLDGIQSAAVVARNLGLEKRLVAYLVAKDGQAVDTEGITARLLEKLPEYMVPRTFVLLSEMPVTVNGKLDYRALPSPSQKRPELRTPFVAPEGEHQTAVCNLWAELLEVDQVGVNDNFFELGGSSLLAVRAAAMTEERLRVKLPVVRMFQTPTVAKLVAHLNGGDERNALRTQLRRRIAPRRDGQEDESEAIAIIGMAGRFPGSKNKREFWENLIQGNDGITYFSPEQIDPKVPAALREDPNYVRARGIIADYDHFDAAFFGVSPVEAELMDPQQRVLLEVAWETLEDAGYAPENTSDSIGIYAGKDKNTYFSEVVSRHPEKVARFGVFNTMLANEKDYVATRTAYALNLKGPAISVHTACSTSLVCVVHAVQALRSRQCDMALAGGVAITVPVESGYLHQEGTMLSPDGHTRTFSDQAGGTVFSDGAAMVLLKPLAEAQRDGDHIYAAIRGVALNNDGHEKASFTAPSVEAQAAVVAQAQQDAQIGASDLSYIETHGTATVLGDPVEVAALKKAFSLSTEDTGFCGLGSVKSNLGHTVIAAGTAGLMKTALALENEVIPKTLWFERPNPALELQDSPFYVTQDNIDWRRGKRRRFAGVSAFGVGGTNAHVIVEEAPLQEIQKEESIQPHVFFISGRSEDALKTNAHKLADYLETNATSCLRDVAFTLHEGRARFAYRAAFVASNHSELAEALRSDRLAVSKHSGTTAKVAFLFPGQGSQHPNMGRSLFETQPIFRSHFARCEEILLPKLGRSLSSIIFNEDTEAAAEVLRRTEVTQPALFTVEYCLARFWEELGLKPVATIGHSVGEFVGATLAGVMSLEDALTLVAERGRIMQAQAPGKMLSVRLSAQDVLPRLSGELCVASENAPQLCVVAGPSEEIDAFQRQLEADEIGCRPLVTSHAFHSSMMEPAVVPFLQLVQSVQLHAPKEPFVSTATGTWITKEEAQDPSYWANHLRRPVKFSQAVRTLLADPDITLLEVGPRVVLTTLSQQHEEARGRKACLASLGNHDESSLTTFHSVMGELWKRGFDLDSAVVHGPTRCYRLPLPTYSFAKKRHWLEPETTADAASPHERAKSDAVLPTSPESFATVAESKASTETNANARSSATRALIENQLSLMQQQLEVLRIRRMQRRD